MYLFTDAVEDQLDEEEDVPSSVCLAKSLGVSASQVQLQKASFFGTDEDEFPDQIYQNGKRLKL